MHVDSFCVFNFSSLYFGFEEEYPTWLRPFRARLKAPVHLHSMDMLKNFSPPKKSDDTLAMWLALWLQYKGFHECPWSSVFLGHGFFLGTWYYPSKKEKVKRLHFKRSQSCGHHSFSLLDPIRNHPSSQGKAQAQYEVCRRVMGTIVRITFWLRYCIVAVWCIKWFGFHGWYVESMDSHGVPSCWEWLHSGESSSIWPNVLAILPVSLRF